MIRTSNPALNDEVFSVYSADSNVMTINGVVHRTGVLLLLAMMTAGCTWHMFMNEANAMPWVFGGAIGGFIMAMVTIFKKSWAGVTAPIYALFEGLFLGGISAAYNVQFQGIVIQAVGLTFGILLSLLIAYRSGLIKATENFKLGVFAATGGIALFYLISIIGSLFGFSMPLIHSSGPLGIGLSLFIVVIASLNLVLDFDFIENGVDSGAPKYMEWYAAFGLMVTLVWLYLEILRLLAKLNSRR